MGAGIGGTDWYDGPISPCSAFTPNLAVDNLFGSDEESMPTAIAGDRFISEKDLQIQAVQGVSTVQDQRMGLNRTSCHRGRAVSWSVCV